MGPWSFVRRQRAVAVFLVAGLLASAAASEPRRRALLIGINEYRAKTIPDLRGALNDVELMKGVLTSRFGFPSENIEVLTDEAATREGILQALERFGARSRPDDRLYVHFSGHGSQVRDAGGDEVSDGLDETLVPHDGRTAGIADITDDELAERFADYPTPHLVVVLDSCHSGTATRSVSAIRPRRVARDERDELYPDSASRQVVALTEGGHVLMTGAAHDQQALDGPVEGQTYGFFSYSLARSMGRADPSVSPRELLEGVEAELERLKGRMGLASLPTPQLEAERERLDEPIWSGARAPEGEARVDFIPVEPIGSGRVRLVKGLAQGAVRRSTWAIHPPGDADLEPGSALALAEVVELDGADAVAGLQPADAKVAKGSRAVAAAPPPVPGGVDVRLLVEDPDLSKRLRGEIQQRLDAVRFVDENAFARFHVRIQGGECLVLGADGMSEVDRFAIASEEQLATALVAILARSMNVAELLSLDHPSSAIQLQLERVGVGSDEPVASDEGGVVLVASSSSSRARIAAHGQSRSAETSLQVRVRASERCFLTLVDVDAEGGVNLLFPNALSEARGYLPNGELPADTWVSIPDSLEAANEAGFYVDFAEPPGDDTLRAFCAAEESVARGLRDTIGAIATPSTASPAAQAGERVAEAASIFDRARRLLTRSLTRGMKITPAGEETAAIETIGAPPMGGEAATESTKPEGGSDAGEDEAEATTGGEAEAATDTDATGSTPMVPGADWAAASLHVRVER